MLDYLKALNILCNTRFAFRKPHSTMTSLPNVINLWFRDADEGNLSMCVFFDLKKPFDTVDYCTFLSRLSVRCTMQGTQVVYILPDKKDTLPQL